MHTYCQYEGWVSLTAGGGVVIPTRLGASFCAPGSDPGQLSIGCDARVWTGWALHGQVTGVRWRPLYGLPGRNSALESHLEHFVVESDVTLFIDLWGTEGSVPLCLQELGSSV